MKRILITGLILTSIAGTSYAAGTGRESGSGRPAAGRAGEVKEEQAMRLKKALEAATGKPDVINALRADVVKFVESTPLGVNSADISSLIKIESSVMETILESIATKDSKKLEYYESVAKRKGLNSESVKDAMLLESFETNGVKKMEDFKSEVQSDLLVASPKTVDDIIVENLDKHADPAKLKDANGNELSREAKLELFRKLCRKKA